MTLVSTKALSLNWLITINLHTPAPVILAHQSTYYIQTHTQTNTRSWDMPKHKQTNKQKCYYNLQSVYYWSWYFCKYKSARMNWGSFTNWCHSQMTLNPELVSALSSPLLAYRDTVYGGVLTLLNILLMHILYLKILVYTHTK